MPQFKITGWKTPLVILLLVTLLSVGNELFKPFLKAERGIKIQQNLQASFFQSGTVIAKKGQPRPKIKLTKLIASSTHEAAEEELVEIHDPKEGQKTICFYTPPLEPSYQAELKEIRITDQIEPGEYFKAEVILENTGNINWFSDNSECSNQPAFRLGTALPQDRKSSFFNLSNLLDNGWTPKDGNRIKMKEEMAAPGEQGTFVFWGQAPEENNIYREYFSPVVEKVQWLFETVIYVQIEVGEMGEEDLEKAHFLNKTGKISDLAGEKNIEVDLSDQKMLIKFGETVVREYQISSGAYGTPTPTGNFSILNKQELRIGGKWPYYHMPKWQGFTQWGHGLHALPYLANDQGAFWYEALNHIGIPVSHGCIRLLPEDAAELFELTDLGTPILIHR